MAHELSRQIALAKQHFEELTKVASIDALTRREYGSGAKRQHLEELLRKLNSLLTAIERSQSTQLDAEDETPLVELSSGVRDFYTKTLEPNVPKIRDAYWDISGLSELNELLKGIEIPKNRTPIAEAVGWAVERWVTMLDEGEMEEWLDRGFDLDGAIEILNKRFFAPDRWLDNLRLLRPVFIDQPRARIPAHVQYRLREIYRAFTFGLWMSAIALSRSVTEYSIIHNASRLGIEATRERKGRREFKPFGLLIAEVVTARPELRVPLEIVKETGDRILHPKKKRDVEIISMPKVMRDEALACITQSRVVIESLYTAPRASDAAG